jgi:hypothetical protein
MYDKLYPSPSRERWRALGRKKQRSIIASAKRGERWPDDNAALVAIGWAWAVLGPPDDRKKVGVFDQVLDVILTIMAEPQL